MEHLINKRVKEIEISGIRKFFNLVSKYPNTVSLTIGQPDFQTPAHVKNAGIEAIKENRTTYTHNAGLIELRKAASNFVKKYNLSYNPETEVIVTNGASEGIDTALRTILEEGCEVILPSPVYPGYEPIIKLQGAKPVLVDTSDTGFKITAEQIKENITEKTRCIILPYPSNPTGVVLTKKEIDDIAKVIQDKNIFVLSDEIYSELVYDGEHYSIAEHKEMRGKTILINGLSKSHSMTGWRIGLIFAPEYITKQMLKVHQYNATCASSISQYAALEALRNGLDDPLVMKDEYKKRRDYVYDRIKSMGLDCVIPSGAFYIFPSIKKFNLPSFDFALRLVKEAGVAVVPGDAFSPFGEGYIRISYAYSMDVLEEGLNRMEKFINSI